MRSFLEPDPPNAAMFIDYWLQPSRKVLLIKPVTGDWDTFELTFELGLDLPPGTAVTVTSG